ncbi:hypothetical protein HPP92_011206 [Vanilla planifolia]|uniref:DUF1639 family protein n=1 Tax=Vanilla planifolia TaxID=51239 RepID=A0A835RB05_VANPL|nr:hypothetical protein HPP92_011526 [Vanilla planifolia]KAG0483122.1 hypothetical protein HPP92_011206 [Vanilla planifolia]
MATTATHRGKPECHLPHRDLSSKVLNHWGGQRCDGVDENRKGVSVKRRSVPTAPKPTRDHRRQAPRIGGPGFAVSTDDGGLKELRVKILGQLRNAADRIRIEARPMDRPATSMDQEAPEPAIPSAGGEAAMPWTLRTRSAAQRAPSERMARLMSEEVEKKEQRKFSISLSREEIEEDIFALTGSRPRRRPKKRARIVQRQLDAIFPGQWLSDITPESYSVTE